MKKVIIRDQEKEKTLYVSENSNLLAVLREHGYLINASCGGNGQCKKCAVTVNGKSELSCQTIVREDVIVELKKRAKASKSLIIDTLTPHNHIAIDLGTTTLAGYLINPDHQRVIATYSLHNPQMSYGADIISRIKHCSLGKLSALHQLIVQAINEIIIGLLPKQKPQSLIISGNTVMLHILMNEDPTLIGRSPYTANFLLSKEFSGDLLGIKAEKVRLLPSISSFIGADIVAGCLVIDILQEKENVLLLDLGTNGEMIVKAKGKLYGTSTAMGPAFEGANIEMGMGGVDGAISAVNYEESLTIETVSGEPEGLCGSGLIDIIAILRNEHLIDETGLLRANQKSKLASRITDGKFYLTDRVYLTQKDIREFQLAKSAVVAGIMVLLEKAGITLSSLKRVYLAGSFGFHMNKKSAVTAGLLPEELKDKIIVIGNSSGLGSVMVANDQSLMEICNKIAAAVTVVDLNKEPKFSQYFIKYMHFTF